MSEPEKNSQKNSKTNIVVAILGLLAAIFTLLGAIAELASKDKNSNPAPSNFPSPACTKGSWEPPCPGE